jgi:hypothetical protein
MEGIHSSGGSSLAEDWSGAPTPSDHRQNSPRNDSSLPKAHNSEVVVEETMCRRSTFFVNVDWRMGATLATATNIVGQMYVECLEPARRLYPYPIVLIHGDFHTGQVSMKPPVTLKCLIITLCRSRQPSQMDSLDGLRSF